VYTVESNLELPFENACKEAHALLHHGDEHTQLLQHIVTLPHTATPCNTQERTHYYTMAMSTHNIFPPPTTVGGEFGEERRVQVLYRCSVL